MNAQQRLTVLMGHCHYREPGGEDASFRAEAAMLRDHGHTVIAYTRDNHEIDAYGPVDRFRLAYRTVWNGEVYRSLRHVLAENRPSLAHFQNTFPLISPAAYAACRHTGVPVVQTLRNYRLLCPNALFFRAGHVCEDCLGRSVPWPGVVHGCYRGSRAQSSVVAAMVTLHRWLKTWQEQVDIYITLTEFARRKFIAGGLSPEKIVVKPNFVDPDPGVRDADGGYALFVGRLAPEKGAGTLLGAWRHLRGIPLQVAGDGPLRGELAEFVRSQRLDGQVELLGHRPRAEVLALMKGARVLIFPSECHETFGRVAIEAFACGVPVIASRLGAVAEVVEDGRTGLHFEPGNPDDLAARVEWAFSRPREMAQMGQQARAEYETHYTAERNYQSLMGIYNLAMERAKLGARGTDSGFRHSRWRYAGMTQPLRVEAPSRAHEQLMELINTRRAAVAVMGLGYVGMPLVAGFAQAGFRVIGIDVDEQKVIRLSAGDAAGVDIGSDLLGGWLQTGQVRFTTDEHLLREADAISICVPTPLRESQEPDLSFVQDAVDKVRRCFRPGQLIVLESTTYPGTTEELLLEPLSTAGYRVGQDFFLGFSPERIDPGNRRFQLRNTPRIFGGVTPLCSEAGSTLYRNVCSEVVVVSSPRVAELAKLLENTFRAVNIGFINEMALLSEKLGVDIWEVIRAASTKPFGFMPFYPGPGIGGHCIPLDPMYLAWKAKGLNFYSRYIELTQELNRSMPGHVVSKLMDLLNSAGKPLKGSRILLLGMAYKPDVDDVREAPGLEILRLLMEKGADVSFHDPYAPAITLPRGGQAASVPLTPGTLMEADCVVLVTAHTCFDYPALARQARLILDTRNAFGAMSADHISRLGAPR